MLGLSVKHTCDLHNREGSWRGSRVRSRLVSPIHEDGFAQSPLDLGHDDRKTRRNSLVKNDMAQGGVEDEREETTGPEISKPRHRSVTGRLELRRGISW